MSENSRIHFIPAKPPKREKRVGIYCRVSSNSSGSDDFEIISSLPKPCQDIYSVYIIEGEVNNGGFNQCYFNSSRQFTNGREWF